MPLIDAGFIDQEKNRPDPGALRTYGPSIQVTVGPQKAPDKLDELKVKTVWALVDTGAYNCMIDSRLAEELGLITVDKAMVSGVGGVKEHSIFMAGIIVPQLNINQFGRFLAAELKDGKQEHEVLLGRDFLSNTIMIYDGIRSIVTIASPK